MAVNLKTLPEIYFANPDALEIEKACLEAYEKASGIVLQPQCTAQESGFQPSQLLGHFAVLRPYIVQESALSHTSMHGCLTAAMHISEV